MKGLAEARQLPASPAKDLGVGEGNARGKAKVSRRQSRTALDFWIVKLGQNTEGKRHQRREEIKSARLAVSVCCYYMRRANSDPRDGWGGTRIIRCAQGAGRGGNSRPFLHRRIAITVEAQGDDGLASKNAPVPQCKLQKQWGFFVS